MSECAAALGRVQGCLFRQNHSFVHLLWLLLLARVASNRIAFVFRALEDIKLRLRLINMVLGLCLNGVV